METYEIIILLYIGCKEQVNSVQKIYQGKMGEDI